MTVITPLPLSHDDDVRQLDIQQLDIQQLDIQQLDIQQLAAILANRFAATPASASEECRDRAGFVGFLAEPSCAVPHPAELGHHRRVRAVR